MRGFADDWALQRTALLTYANRHPSESVRKLGNEAAEALENAFRSASYLFLSHRTGEVGSAYKEAEGCHEKAVERTQKLMDAIRDY